MTSTLRRLRFGFHRRFTAYTLASIALLLGAGPTFAHDLGRIGPTYPIAEPDFVAAIQRKLEQLQRDGSLARLESEAQSRLHKALLEPPPVDGVSRATVPATHWYDPSITFSSPIIDDAGRVLVAPGERRNPLDVLSLQRNVVFFDARDPAQRRFVLHQMKASPAGVTPIVVGGSAMVMMRQWGTAVFADQDGRIVRQLGITRVPAVLSQEGKRLRIDTIVVPEEQG